MGFAKTLLNMVGHSEQGNCMTDLFLSPSLCYPKVSVIYIIY